MINPRLLYFSEITSNIINTQKRTPDLEAGFKSIEILQEVPYIEEVKRMDGRKITSLVIKAIK